jgi:ketosteroid isomerase-like protein
VFSQSTTVPHPRLGDILTPSLSANPAAGDRFIVRFDYDVTNKPSGRRFKMSEAGLFTVKDGKIVREEFFYATEG